MQGDIKKALEIISRHAAMAQGNHSFGHLRAKPVAQADGEDLEGIKLHGMPGSVATPGAELNTSVQEHVLGHQDHQLPDDEFLPGSEEADGHPEPDEDDAPTKSAAVPMGFMSTNPSRMSAPEKPKKRVGRPRGSK